MSTFNDLKKQYIDITMSKLHNDMMSLEEWIKKDKSVDNVYINPVSDTNTIHDKLDAIFNRIQIIEEGMNEIRSRVDDIEHRCTWNNYTVPCGDRVQNDIIECNFFDPAYSPRRNPKVHDDTLSNISHEDSIIDFNTTDNITGIIEVHKEGGAEPVIAAAPSVVYEEDVEGEADEHEIIIEEEKYSVGEAVDEEEEEVVEEEEEEVIEEEDELEEIVYKNKTYYKDSENNVYRLNKDGDIDDTPIGRWNEKTQSIRFTVVA
jgi:tetrahydromethanopterin S-methyltransferase subunit G